MTVEEGTLEVRDEKGPFIKKPPKTYPIPRGNKKRRRYCFMFISAFGIACISLGVLLITVGKLNARKHPKDPNAAKPVLPGGVILGIGLYVALSVVTYGLVKGCRTKRSHPLTYGPFVPFPGDLPQPQVCVYPTLKK